ncbi:TadE/TadG family type IV pilus assembly protein [Occallatibacter savannae]|uniref:TadE/TadG family type IV pilus assembly protein n=1 Tax=Occallatibacter savannae TaxID=1002691 RepID=UPI000D69198E|nr:TadE/TadG family type IV pilus assembly protein [Occallatibacter savannae]
MKNEDGQSLVELALTLPLLLVLLLGVAELGHIAYASINVSNAAKAAGQYAAQNTSTAVQTGSILAAAQNEVATVPGLVGSLSLDQPTSMPDGSPLPTGTVCNASGSSYSCSYCSCSSPDIDPPGTDPAKMKYPPFACGAGDALTRCVGNSHLEQNIIIETRIAVSPVVTVPGMDGPMNMYGHAVVKRLQ